MKANRLFGFSPILGIAALAMLVGCIAQTGAPEDQSQSQTQPLAATGSNEQLAQSPLVQKQIVSQDSVALQKLVPAGNELLDSPKADPGSHNTDNGDGTEPDPHPWEPHASVAYRP